MRTPDALYSIPRQSLVSPGMSSTPQKASTGVPPPTSTSSDAALQSGSPITHNAAVVHPPTVHSPAAPLVSPVGTQSAPPPAAQGLRVDTSSNWPSGGTNQWDDNLSPGATLHPAIRAHYAAMLSNRNVKTEHQIDSNGTSQPLAMIPSLPTVASAPSNIPASSVPATPIATTSSASPTPQPTSRLSAQPKSTTPIPPPSLPVASRIAPGASAKGTPAVPKKTHIPAPRPWETLRKAQQSPAQPVITQPSPPVHMMPTSSPISMTPSSHMLPAYGLPENSGYLPNAGYQPNHVVSRSLRQTHPPAMPNSNRFSLPALGCPPYGNPHQQPPPYHHPSQYVNQRQHQTRLDGIIPLPFQVINPQPYHFPQHRR